MFRLLAFAALVISSCASTGRPQDVRLASSAPEDQTVRFNGKEPEDAIARWHRLVAPHVAKAVATYPEAKRRYLAGLPPGHTFFVTTLILDRQNHFENTFVVVDHIKGQTVVGRIATELALVQDHKKGDLLTFPESDVIDWTISRPDGSEDGNFVGKFLATLPPPN